VSIRSILYVAPLSGTSLYRRHAFDRLGMRVVSFEPSDYLPTNPILIHILDHMPLAMLVEPLNRALIDLVRKEKPDVVWFDKPIYFTRATVRAIKALGAFTICYNQDNPFGPRKDGCWFQFKRIFRLFDLHCLFREADVERYGRWKLPFYKTMMSYDPAQHFPAQESAKPPQDREISYIGSPFEDRPQFLLDLSYKHGLPVSISGPRWKKFISPQSYRELVKDDYLANQAYREAIWRSKINLAFNTHLNEDDVAHKSAEITACGGFLLALRTKGHQAMFEEGREAEFFSSIDECATKIRYYLAHPEERMAIARRGCERAWRSGYDNDTQLSRILARAEEMRASTPGYLPLTKPTYSTS